MLAKGKIELIARRLRRCYADWDHHNRANPLDELLFILCSTKTQENGYRGTYAALKREFPTFARLAEAPPEYIANLLQPGGLFRQKSKAIRQICEAISVRFGKLTLAPLRGMNNEQCEAFLTSLPFVGKKIARCVMMYSLEREVFPVDTHCWKICRRLGWVRPTQKGGRPSARDVDRLQAKIPLELRFSLHVNMVSLGREFCTSERPKCQRCPLGDLCPKVGVVKAHVIASNTRKASASQPLFCR